MMVNPWARRRRAWPCVRAVGAWLGGVAVGCAAPALAGQAGIPWSELGARVSASYAGDGLAVMSTETGARLRSAFQRLEGEVGPGGLTVHSTAGADGGGRLSLKAVAVGRAGRIYERADHGVPAARAGSGPERLAACGTVLATEDAARWVRPGLIEEYRVSADGLRQDFLVEARPAGAGALRVELEVSGGAATPADGGARLVLSGSGRALAYHRLNVSDAKGRALRARLAVLGSDRLAVVVEDSGAVYPVRIDPTFSDADWISFGEYYGLNDMVYAVAGDGTNLYAAGTFTIANNQTANRIARWDGTAWTNLGSGVNSTVNALALDGAGHLYAGGSFSSAGGRAVKYVARWDGSAWTNMGSGLGGTVYALACDAAGTLYAGGYFTNAGSLSANYMACWDGSSWTNMGSGMNSYVRALALDGAGRVYAGGWFTNAGGLSASRVARWDGSSWTNLGDATLDGTVYALALSPDGTTLYAGGNFTSVGGTDMNRVARWNVGTGAWSTMGSGMNNVVYALAVNEAGYVYAGGLFTTASGSVRNRIARWTGSSWGSVGAGVDNTIQAVACVGGRVYAGGSFSMSGSKGMRYMAEWDGSAWHAFGRTRGLDNQVSAAVCDRTGKLYVGGAFQLICDSNDIWEAVNYIACWDGSAWTTLAGGMDGSVSALALDENGQLYAGGAFQNAGSIGANRIARWDGTNWHKLGSGLNSTVSAIALDGMGRVYAGGAFTYEGGFWWSTPLNRVACWDGSGWTNLGDGFNSVVYALACDGPGTVYAGGAFSSSGGTALSRIARWDGTAWTDMGSGMNSAVNALAVDGAGHLYAGGSFTNAGGLSANYVARWDGASWSSLSSGMNSYVRALTFDGAGNLYAGGGFTTAGSRPAKGVACWDGAAWTNIGSGADNAVMALASDGACRLYAGGSLLNAGGTQSLYLAGVILGESAPAFFGTNGAQLVSGAPASAEAGTQLAGPWGEPTRHTLSVSNGGTGPLAFYPAAITGSGRGAFALEAPGFVAPDAVSNLVVTFEAPTVGAYTASVALAHNGGSSPFAISLAGTASKRGQAIDFPAVPDTVTTARVALSATATSGLPVAFEVSGGPAALDGPSNVVFTGAGPVFIEASQAGDASWHAASPVTQRFEVGLSGQGLLTFTPASPQAYATTQALAGAVSGGSGTGALSFEVRAGPGSIVDGSRLRVTAGTGTILVVATKAADALFLEAAATAEVAAARAPQAIEFDPVGPALATEVLGLAARAASGQPVTFEVAGGPGEVVGTNLSFSGAGQVFVAARQAGDTNWAPGNATQTVSVSKAPGTVQLHRLSHTYDGTPREASATTEPAGLAVRLTYNGMPEAPLDAGRYEVVGALDDARYAGAATGQLEVARADQAIQFPPIPEQAVTARVALAATAESGLPVYYGVRSGPGALSGGTYPDYIHSTLTFTGAGLVVVGAYQAGDGNWNPAPGVTNSLQVRKVCAQVQLGNLDQAYNGSPRVVSAATDPAGLPVRVTYNGVVSAPVNAGRYTVIGSVSHAIYEGSATGTLTVGRGIQTIAFSAIPDQAVTGQVTLAARASSGLPVTYAVRAGPGVLSGGTLLSFTGTGRVEVAAAQGGDSNWAPAAPVVRAVNVNGGPWVHAVWDADFDGDGLSDPAIYDGQTGAWTLMGSAGGYARLSFAALLGGPVWTPAAGDYDGDGLADPGVYEEATGAWKVMQSGLGYALLQRPAYLGGPGWTGFAADFDGDGKADYAVYEEAGGSWTLKLSGAGYAPLTLSGFLGGAGWQAVGADVDGDGRADPATYRQADGTWKLRLSGSGYAPLTLSGFLGGPGWGPAPGDYDGDGLADPAVRSADGRHWRVRLSGSGYALVEVVLGL